MLRGQYRIDGYLGAGGFGITYLAVDSLDRKVVIKECFPNSMCSRSGSMVRARSRAMQIDFEAVVRQFGLEARRMSKLKHPNIVGVHQVFEDNGTAYMALDLVKGRELLDIIETDRHSLTPTCIKAMLLKMLEAVDYVHERDVLHRDISPDNILIKGDENPVLIDFGAAREVASKASRMLSSLHIVKDGYSPQEFYLANSTQTPSSDLYSLAATFYHLITGAPPPNSQVRLAALAADEMDPFVPIPPRTDGYDRFFIGAINKALAVFPKDRLQTAGAWIEEIDQDRRQMALFETAKKDQDIELVIHAMTAETNRELMASAKNDELANRKPKVRTANKNKSRVQTATSEPSQDAAAARHLDTTIEIAPEYAGSRLSEDDQGVGSDWDIEQMHDRRRSLVWRIGLFVIGLIFARKRLPRRQGRRAPQ